MSIQCQLTKRKLQNRQVSQRILVWYTIVLLVFILIYLCLKYNKELRIITKNFVVSEENIFRSSHFRYQSDCRTYNISSKLNAKSVAKSNESDSLKSNETIPELARVLYLFLCENQAEINAYSKAFPSVTADVMFFCWRQNCNHRKFSKLTTFYVAQWSGSISKNQSFVQLHPKVNYTKIQSRVFIINEHQLNLTTKTTWTTARNILLKRAFMEEHRQGWRWAYFNFVDGDIKTECPLAEKFLEKTERIDADEIIFADHFRSLMEKTINKDKCFILIDAFLLSVSPAIGVFANMGPPILYDDLLTQIVYHIDAMFNAFHRDAVQFVLPYCPRYDERSWWTSQAILVYRSLCLYGHVIQFNAVYMTATKHRKYPRTGDAFQVDQNMNFIPSSLIHLKKYMNQSRNVSPLVLRQYRGWSLEMITDECRQKHTFMNPLTCKVSGDENKTKF